MPSTSLGVDDTASVASWWSCEICWDYEREYRDDWNNERWYYHEALPDEKPRLRGRHRDSKWHGARAVNHYNDTIWKALDIRNTYVNAYKFLDTDGRPRNVKWLHEPMLEPLTSDPFSLAFKVPYSLAKKKRWRIPVDLRQDIEKFQDNYISLRTSLAVDRDNIELHNAFGWGPRTTHGRQAIKEFVSVDEDGKALHKRSRSHYAHLADLDRKPLSGKQIHNVYYVQSVVASSSSEGQVHPLGKRDPPNERPVHVVYNASEFEVTKHQFNAAERWQSCKRYWWYHANRSKNGGRRKANDRWDIADHEVESDDGSDPRQILESTDDPVHERQDFSMADYVVHAAPKKKRTKKQRATSSSTFHEDKELESIDFVFECPHALLPAELEGPSTSSLYAERVGIPDVPLLDIPALVSLHSSDASLQQDFGDAKHLPIWPPTAVLSGRPSLDILVVRNIGDPLYKRVYSNPGIEVYTTGTNVSSSVRINPKQRTSVLQAVLPSWFWLAAKCMSGAEAEEKALELIFDKGHSEESNQTPTDFEFDLVPFCGVCHQLGEAADGFALIDCGHYFCAPCWRKHIEVCLSTKKIPIECMAFGCDARVHPSITLAVIPQTYTDRYRQLVIEQRQMRKDFLKCSRCHRTMFVEGLDTYSEAVKKPQVTICECGFEICIDCGDPAHLPLSCQQWRLYEHTMGENSHALKASQEEPVSFKIEAAKCLACGSLVLPQEGTCARVKCPCGFQFCCKCGQYWFAYQHTGCWSENMPEMEIVDRRSSYGTLPTPIFQKCAEWRLKTSAKSRKRLTEKLAFIHGPDFAKDACHKYVQLCQLVERSIAARFYRSQRINPRHDDEFGRKFHAVTEHVAYHLRLIENPVVLSNSRRKVEAEHLESAMEASKKFMNLYMKLTN